MTWASTCVTTSWLLPSSSPSRGYLSWGGRTPALWWPTPSPPPERRWRWPAATARAGTRSGPTLRWGLLGRNVSSDIISFLGGENYPQSDQKVPGRWTRSEYGASLRCSLPEYSLSSLVFRSLHRQLKTSLILYVTFILCQKCETVSKPTVIVYTLYKYFIQLLLICKLFDNLLQNEYVFMNKIKQYRLRRQTSPTVLLAYIRTF